ncbi:MAG: hypothetical protein ABWU16_04030 [Halothiobacillaceae bacterium]
MRPSLGTQASEGEDWKRRELDTLHTLEGRDEHLGTAVALIRLALEVGSIHEIVAGRRSSMATSR